MDAGPYGYPSFYAGGGGPNPNYPRRGRGQRRFPGPTGPPTVMPPAAKQSQGMGGYGTAGGGIRTPPIYQGGGGQIPGPGITKDVGPGALGPPIQQPPAGTAGGGTGTPGPSTVGGVLGTAGGTAPPTVGPPLPPGPGGEWVDAGYGQGPLNPQGRQWRPFDFS